MFNHSHSLLCDFWEEGGFADITSLNQKFILIKSKYLNEFFIIKLLGTTLIGDIYSYTTICFQLNFIGRNEIILWEYVKQEYFRLMNYNKFFWTPGGKKTIDKFNVVYIDDDSTIKVNTENGFSDMANPVIIVDTGNFAGLYYLDSLNTRCLFFQMESREDFFFFVIRI